VTDTAHKTLAASDREDQRSAFTGVKRRPRGAETRITDPTTHPRRYVSLVVAAEYLEVDRKTLGVWLLNRKLAFVTFGKRRKIEVSELVAFERRQRTEAKAG
jgi:excisionase family DNA binding protein